jgi:CDP-diacylglycerol---serine O-phosphatidyltransferase
MNDSPEKKRKLPHLPDAIHRGIYLLPSMLTMANILFGFSAIMVVINHVHDPDAARYFSRASILIVIAGLFDAIDGRVARLTNSTSPFGMQLDSIADVISFGIAPGVLVYSWGLSGFHRLGWIASFLYLGCGAIRLARFNVLEDDHESKSKRFFIGLPIPAAAGFIAMMVLFFPDISSPGTLAFIALCAVYLLSFLMISKFRYRSFKDIDWSRRRPVGTLFFFVLLLTIILYNPITVMFLMAICYILSGLIVFFVPETSKRFFNRIDRLFVDVKVLDDDESVDEDPENTE